jgi:glycosyltransferase involved in cell wall biosynthesis
MNNPRILMLDTAYWEVLSNHHSADMRDEKEDLEFGLGFYLNKAFNKIGWQSDLFFINDIKSQVKWLHDNDIKYLDKMTKIKDIITESFDKFSKPRKAFNYMVGWQIARIQMQHLKPDIIWFFDPAHTPPIFVKTMPNRKNILKIAHISSPLPKLKWFENYDLMLSSQRANIGIWREMNLRAEYFKQAVDPESCYSIEWEKRKFPLTFIGGISKLHIKRQEILEKISNEFEISFFGPGKDNIPKNFNLKNKWNYPVWGKDMYKLLADSKISLNIHGDISQNEAANLRLLEVTGSGTLLITEDQPNLTDYFNSDEVVSYNSVDDLIEKIKYYMQNSKVASQIAEAGRKRALFDHTYDNRVNKLSAKLINILGEELL